MRTAAPPAWPQDLKEERISEEQLLEVARAAGADMDERTCDVVSDLLHKGCGWCMGMWAGTCLWCCAATACQLRCLGAGGCPTLLLEAFQCVTHW